MMHRKDEPSWSAGRGPTGSVKRCAFSNIDSSSLPMHVDEHTRTCEASLYCVLNFVVSVFASIVVFVYIVASTELFGKCN